MPSRPTPSPVAVHPSRLGSESWLRATGGNLTRRQRAALLRPVVQSAGALVAGRLALAVGRHSGREAALSHQGLVVPDSPAATDAAAAAAELLSPGLLRHSYRTYAWAAALAQVSEIAFDAELLFVAAMLHDAGLPAPTAGTDFTLRSIELLDAAGLGAQLGTERRQVVVDAMGSHHTPGVRLEDGAERFLLSAGAAVDVLGMRVWELPTAVVSTVQRDYPRAGFPREMARLWTAESRAVPRGRAAFLRRWAAINLLLHLAPLER